MSGQQKLDITLYRNSSQNWKKNYFLQKHDGMHKYIRDAIAGCGSPLKKGLKKFKFGFILYQYKILSEHKYVYNASMEQKLATCHSSKPLISYTSMHRC